MVGQPAPEFTLPSSMGGEVSLADFRGKQHVVLVFYPLDFSSVCSMQLPEYSGMREAFEELDTAVLGINRDSVYTHKAWSAEYGIEIPLLADMTFEVARAYGVHLEDKGMSTRAVFLIDKQGVVRFAYQESAPGQFTLHAEQLLEKIKEL
nr:redoxin domain-containing protein [Deinobacterium chartae]